MATFPRQVLRLACALTRSRADNAARMARALRNEIADVVETQEKQQTIDGAPSRGARSPVYGSRPEL